mmetsp:Transcript_10334/g.19021  ORF Transcript_10334/g.19021 Transcript_10334/m.19021 type:complete len:291 (+) Transcript_10334:2272-3144(+)|eukprot:CAMPEP_0201681140 /NCGR_PEP_ID=MMETSP0494-20130426/50956_1 /ASSEMBLY_ACC=CAM_ASM_000839 /TAXON_ID=420259 /ORGANISM="Thalassiosira gravida, Strain GMp14c1" /LENGTH=290 /DNA_ID=CAMNT_0048164875 /DNA_START=3310 /DNA_END=4182 /DNA_ORIENTATION=-
MDRFGLGNSRDDSSTESEYSTNSTADRTKRATSFVKLSSIPSMYSPASKSSRHIRTSSDDSINDEASSHATNESTIDYDQFTVSNEIKDLFKIIDAYQPVDLDLETPLKCFVPPKYFVAVGDVDPFIKIPRPDGVPDGLGTVILDEPIRANQSNAAVIELQLRNHSKSEIGRVGTVRSITNAAENTNEIDHWIQSVEEIHATKSHSEVKYRNKMPSMENMLQAWPKEIEDELRNGTLELPSADIDLNVDEYARMLCSLLGIPVYDGCMVDSVHALISLFVESQVSSNVYA